MYLIRQVVCYTPGMKRAKIISSREIGETIKFRRQDVGMSQERLAEIVGVSYQQIQRYENGKNKLNVENIQIIAEALSVPMTFFFPEQPHKIAEPLPPYQSTDEKTLLQLYRKIPAKADKDTVVRVARSLAVKK
jgi:transcriptional regulator with XRE-family HTH domain